MKKVLIPVAVTVFLLTGCAGNKSKEDAAAEAVALEIQKTDSLTFRIDSLKDDIDSSVTELENLLNEL